MWEQWVGLMTRINGNVTNDLVCLSQYPNEDQFEYKELNYCYLSQPCSTAAYAPLWNYTFNFDFAIKKPTMNVGLGSLAVDENGVCLLGVRGNTYTNTVTIGAFALQNFNVLFNNTGPSGKFTANIIPSASASYPSGTSLVHVNQTNATASFPYW